jgi:GNAT superfamily N-acetyltransferase
MLDRWFSVIRLPLSLRQLQRLPQDPAYRYEYFQRAAWLSPRPKFYNARLDLRPPGTDLLGGVEAQQSVRFRRLEDRDWPRLSRLFAGAFRRVQPFASLGDRRRLEAARACLKQTREGGDGPVIEPACYVALGADQTDPVGAFLVTLIPLLDLDHLWGFRWKTPPPPDCIERHLGRPHLTWVFVSPDFAGYGVGTALLAHAAGSLLALGYSELISSFILGNTSSMLWHWRNGFQLLAYSGSRRKFQEMMRATHSQSSPLT